MSICKQRRLRKTMGGTRIIVGTMALIMIAFVATFLVVSNSRLSPASGATRRSRHVLQRLFKAASASSLMSAGYQHAVQRMMALNKSKSEVHTPYAAQYFRRISSTAAQNETINDKSTSIARLHFQSQNENRILNKTRMFKNPLNRSERATLLTMLGSVADALTASNVTFWMDGGTLLGSYRYHNVIPWDDDVDLILSGSQKSRVYRAITALAPVYELYVDKNPAELSDLIWRVFASNASAPVPRKRFRFPTIDLLFYAENATHVWLELHNIWSYAVWRRKTVFPLHLRPFGMYWLPAPCNTQTYLIKEYDTEVMDICKSHRTSHQRDIGLRQISVPCQMLRRIPLVSREHNGTGSVTETLLRGEKVIHQHVIRKKC